jgi:hypothetical protein
MEAQYLPDAVAVAAGFLGEFIEAFSDAVLMSSNILSLAEIVMVDTCLLSQMPTGGKQIAMPTYS